MINKKTVFVIGAGASVDFGLPVGIDLAKEITQATLPRGGSEITDTFRAALNAACQTQRGGSPTPELVEKAGMISGGLSLAPSIDTFVESHSHDKDIAFIAKVAIAVCILRAERKSKLTLPRPGHSDGFTKATGSWLHELFSIMVTGASRSNMADMFTSVSFIIFNYDRCVEQFFIHALMQYFVCDYDKALKALDSCSIVHPYGSLGLLDWKTIGTHKQFGGPETPTSIGNVAADMSANIRTYSEAETDPALAQRAREIVRWAERVVCLGFAFHDQNVDLLRPAEPSGKHWAIATAFNVSKSNQNAFVDDIIRIANADSGPVFRSSITIAEKSITCAQLIRDEAKRLSR